ncbi:MAG: HlyD family efflux transporter periplasmic adaptor subunit [Verrucomicrobia bacterium]|nr:HlyD family efflux transporter periplasmic adaptor subunit [Verrucomicrobiota bacterium]
MHSTRTHGFISTKALMGLAGAGALSALLWFDDGEEGNSQQIEPIYEEAKVAEFRLEIVEPGEVESAENVEIKSKVKSRGSGGVSILEIIPEGTLVKKGDFLVRLDDAGLQKELLRQRISVHQANANLVKAQADVEAAKLALQEYLSGTFRQNEEQLESAEFVAKENFRRAEEYLAYSQKLAAKGYVSEAQLEADQFAVEKAAKELDLAQTRLEVLRTHTQKAKVNDLNASILTTEARLESARNSYELELTQEREIEDQIVNCTILSPADGEVTYANENNKGVVIAEGEEVRENQTIIRLPDSSRLLVQAKINESRVEQVKTGMKCRITIDAIRDVELEGSVQSVSDYPWPAFDRYRAHIKEYGTKIIINDAPKGLRTGMTAKVTILSELIEDALQIPLPAVFRKKGQAYCLVAGEEEELELREIELGPNNMSHAVVRSGLQEGESVVINPDPFRENYEPSEDKELALY